MNFGGWSDPQPTTENEQKIANAVNHTYCCIYNTVLIFDFILESAVDIIFIFNR